MADDQERKPSPGLWVFSVASLSAAAYFAWAALEGNFGRIVRIGIETEVAEAEAELAEVSVKRRALENKVRRLSDDYLDLELLDEQARRRLGPSRGDEIIIR